MLKDLVEADRKLLETLKQFIEADSEKLNEIEAEKLSEFKKFAEDLDETFLLVDEDVQQHLSHPIHQYLLVKRLAVDWPRLIESISSVPNLELKEQFSRAQKRFPGDDDLHGSMEGLLRLQKTYELDTQKLVEGNVKGFQAYRSLEVEDCFQIGLKAFTISAFRLCSEWMQAALLIEDQNYPEAFTRFDVLDYLSYCSSQEGNYERAYNVSLEILKIDPENKRILENIEQFREWINLEAELRAETNEELMNMNSNVTDQSEQASDSSQSHLAAYKQLCQLEKNITPDGIARRLRCSYWTNHNHPRLVFKPIKMEELWLSPHIVRFYDVINDDEIETIKKIAKPKLNRATVHNRDTGLMEPAHYRVSKSAWLRGHLYSTVAKINRRISHITGLSMRTAEDFQVANYGIGGQYEPHCDFTRTEDHGNFDPKIGNRIATFMFYLSDVSYGGSTVFLRPQIAVRPIRGSAVFWFNLFPSGSGDLRTRHAACPVLVGIKWVANKWIHEIGQEFRRSCKLSRRADNKIF